MFKAGYVPLVLATAAVLACGHLAVRYLVQSPPPLASLALWAAAVAAVTARVALADPQD